MLKAHGKDSQEGPTGAPAEIYSLPGLWVSGGLHWALPVSDFVGWLVGLVLRLCCEDRNDAGKKTYVFA